jgi:hypothetical protein
MQSAPSEAPISHYLPLLVKSESRIAAIKYLKLQNQYKYVSQERYIIHDLPISTLPLGTLEPSVLKSVETACIAVLPLDHLHRQCLRRTDSRTVIFPKSGLQINNKI